jgi:hypothetical protein
MVQMIDTYKDFMSKVVEPDFNEFVADKVNLRRAWHCAGSLFHLHDWVYAAHKASIDIKYKFTDRTNMSYRPFLVTTGPVRRRRLRADGRSAWR